MSYPKSSDKKIRKLTNILVNYAEQNDIKFSLGGEEVYSVETFSDFGALSLFLLEAKELFEKLYNNKFTIEELMQPFGKKIKQLTTEEEKQESDYLNKQPTNKTFPILFEQKEEGTYFGFAPVINKNTDNDFYIISHFALHIIDEYVKQYKNNKSLMINGMIPLDALYDKLIKNINNNKIEIIPEIKVNPIISDDIKNNFSNNNEQRNPS